MATRDPRRIEVEPPQFFDGRSYEEWTAAELLAAAHELAVAAAEAAGDERDRLLMKESDVLRCLGFLCLVLAPDQQLKEEWRKAAEEARTAKPLSPEHIEALTRQAAIERACGAEMMGYDRSYLDGKEPVP